MVDQNTPAIKTSTTPVRYWILTVSSLIAVVSDTFSQSGLTNFRPTVMQAGANS